MNFIVAAATDIGISKKTNQDSFGVKMIKASVGNLAFAVMCDGMGGLSSGEVASATVVDSFNKWAVLRLPGLCAETLSMDAVKTQWCDLINTCNEKIKNHGKKNNISLGTTITAILLTEENYIVVNVGDSRTYEISDRVTQLTKDQSVVAREVELGLITEEQAKADPRRSVLLQCIGASDIVVPDVFIGKVRKNAVYMLCSDGFVHELREDEILGNLRAENMNSKEQMSSNLYRLIDVNKQRMERDNISVIAIRTI